MVFIRVSDGSTENHPTTTYIKVRCPFLRGFPPQYWCRHQFLHDFISTLYLQFYQKLWSIEKACVYGFSGFQWFSTNICFAETILHGFQSSCNSGAENHFTRFALWFPMNSSTNSPCAETHFHWFYSWFSLVLIQKIILHGFLWVSNRQVHKILLNGFIMVLLVLG